MKKEKILCCSLCAAFWIFTANACGVLPENISKNKNIDYLSSQSDSSSLNELYTADCSSEKDHSNVSSADCSSVNDKNNTSSALDQKVMENATNTEISEEDHADKLTIDNPYLTAELDIPELAYVPNDAVCKYLGRTELSDDVLWCAMSGTGCEFEYTGKNLEITFQGDSSIDDYYNHRARIGIFVNGERVADEIIGQSEISIPVIKSESEDTYNVQVIKLSEIEMSTVGIRSIDIDDGESISPAADRPRKIEFIGDSITCGYGIDTDSPYDNFSTATEDITKTFAHKASEILNADYSIFAMSGYGLLSGYTSDPSQINTEAIIPPYYCNLGNANSSFTGNGRPQNYAWNFGRFKPDVIVINLGTNDSTYCKDDGDKLESFIQSYVDFLGQVRVNNPDAEIFCTLGTCSQQIYSQVEQAAERYSAETGDEKVHALLIDSGDSSYGYGANWHPSEASNTLMGDILADEIAKVMGW